MQPSRLTVCLFTVGFVPLLVGVGCALLFGASPVFALVVFGFDAGVFLLFVADAWLASRRRGWRVTREKPARLSVGIDNEVALLLENQQSTALRLILRDEAPAGFGVEPPLLYATVAPRGWLRLPYRLLPTERGSFRFGDIHVRLRGPF